MTHEREARRKLSIAALMCSVREDDPLILELSKLQSGMGIHFKESYAASAECALVGTAHKQYSEHQALEYLASRQCQTDKSPMYDPREDVLMCPEGHAMTPQVIAPLRTANFVVKLRKGKDGKVTESNVLAKQKQSEKRWVFCDECGSTLARLYLPEENDKGHCNVVYKCTVCVAFDMCPECVATVRRDNRVAADWSILKHLRANHSVSPVS